ETRHREGSPQGSVGMEYAGRVRGMLTARARRGQRTLRHRAPPHGGAPARARRFALALAPQCRLDPAEAAAYLERILRRPNRGSEGGARRGRLTATRAAPPPAAPGRRRA